LYWYCVHRERDSGWTHPGVFIGTHESDLLSGLVARVLCHRLLQCRVLTIEDCDVQGLAHRDSAGANNICVRASAAVVAELSPEEPNRTGLTDAAVSIVKQRMLARWNRVGPLLPSSGPFTVRPSVCDGVRRDHKLSKSTWNRQKYQAQNNCNNYDTFHSFSPFYLVWAASPIAALAALWLTFSSRMPTPGAGSVGLLRPSLQTGLGA